MQEAFLLFDSNNNSFTIVTQTGTMYLQLGETILHSEWFLLLFTWSKQAADLFI